MVDSGGKNITRDRKDHFITIMELINQKDLKILNMYTSNISASTYMQQILIKL